jgi:phenylalanine-4-hydroxylase
MKNINFVKKIFSKKSIFAISHSDTLAKSYWFVIEFGNIIKNGMHFE